MDLVYGLAHSTWIRLFSLHVARLGLIPNLRASIWFPRTTRNDSGAQNRELLDVAQNKNDCFSRLLFFFLKQDSFTDVYLKIFEQ